MFVGPDPAEDSVVSVGDALLGSTVTNLFVASGPNEHGQVAFLYDLESGVRGIALATPTHVRGDFDDDGDVDLSDLLEVQAAFTGSQ